jgi:hypothetical protein
MPLSDLILWLAHKRTSSRVKFNHVPCSKCNDLQQREVADYMIVSHLIRLSRAACQYCYLLSRAALMCFDKQSRADGELRVWFPTTNDAQGVFQVEEDEQRARDGRIHYLELFTLPG